VIGIDGDIIAYRAAFSPSAGDVQGACDIALEYIRTIVENLNGEERSLKLYLSGHGNFRDAIGVTKKYKGNRPETRPPLVKEVKEFLASGDWDAAVSQDEEADDLMAIDATTYGDAYTLCSIDKDFDQVPGQHYNFVKFRKYYVTEREAQLFFYKQILTGDRADNVPGIRGIGPVTAQKLLKPLKTDKALFDKCVELHKSYDRVVENATLLWLRRTPGEIWQPPK
jgi:DNA polymerase-1